VTEGAIGWLALWRRHPSALLLFVQLAGVLVYPAMEGARGGRAAFEIFGIGVLVLAVLSVRASPALTWPSGLLGVAAGLLSLGDMLHPADWLRAVSSALLAAFYFYAAAAMLRYMLTDQEVTTDELFAAGATFTLVAWGFAYLFVLVQTIQPGAFAATAHATAVRSWNELLFLSFTTLSSTGLSDMMPATPYARAVVMLEQLAGVGYIAMVVSRLVGMTLQRRP
jgi:hypothetical protein